MIANGKLTHYDPEYGVLVAPGGSVIRGIQGALGSLAYINTLEQKNTDASKIISSAFGGELEQSYQRRHEAAQHEETARFEDCAKWDCKNAREKLAEWDLTISEAGQG